MAVLKQKMPIFWKRSPTKKNVTAQKSLRICFYPYIGGQKKFLFFLEKFFFGTPFEKKKFHYQNFFGTPILLLLWVTRVFDPKNDPLKHLLQDVSKTPPPVQTL